MKQESRIGLYLTIIIHLVALIVVLSLQVSSFIQKESTYILDFTPQEELEMEQQRERIRAEVSEGLDDLIAGIQKESRNVAVDATLGAQLHAVVKLVFARDHGNRGRARRLDDLDGHRA